MATVKTGKKTLPGVSLEILNFVLSKAFGVRIEVERTRPRKLHKDPFRRFTIAGWGGGEPFDMILDRRQNLDWGYEAGLFDLETIKFMEKYITNKSWFVDLGANQGFFSLCALRLCDDVKVLAIEPDPYSQRKFLQNIAINKLGGRTIQLCRSAIGDPTKGEEINLMINTAGNRAGSSTIKDQRRYTGELENEVIPVQCNTLYEIFEEHSVEHVSVLKVDVEGSEPETISKFLYEAPRIFWPRAIVLEELSDSFDSDPRSAIQMLVENGYSLVGSAYPDYFFVRNDHED